MRSVFISPAREDAAIVERLTDDLDRRGFKVFRAYSDISPGESWAARLQHEIESSDLVFVVASRASEKNEFVASEVALALSAFQKGKTLVIPVIAERGAELPYFLRRVQALDYTNPKSPQTQRALDRLLAYAEEHTPDASYFRRDSEAQLDSLRSSKQSLDVEKVLFTERMAARSATLSVAVGTLATVVSMLAAVLSLSDLKSFLGSNLQFILGTLFGLVGSAISIWLIARIRARRRSGED